MSTEGIWKCEHPHHDTAQCRHANHVGKQDSQRARISALADDLTRLRAVAEAATAGPWTENVLGSEGYDVRAENPNGSIRRLSIARCGREDWDTDKANAHFIATFDPPTVAALIDRVERAERERDSRVYKGKRISDTYDALAALRAAVKGLADEWEAEQGERVPIDCHGTCDGCAETKQLVWSYPTPDSEPWLCAECDADGRREITELRGLLTEGADDGQ